MNQETQRAIVKKVVKPTQIITPRYCEVCGEKAEWHSGYLDHLSIGKLHDPPHWLCSKHLEQWNEFHDRNSGEFKILGYDEWGNLDARRWQALFSIFIHSVISVILEDEKY